MLKYVLIAAASAAALAASQAFADEKRELGPHEHGHGTLNIAVEKSEVKMELEVPGDDIVGFEHDPSTEAEKAALAKAKAELAEPLKLFKWASTAGCTVSQADVKIQEEKHHDGDEEEKAKPGEPEAHHNEFHVAYTLSCKAPDAIRTIEFVYFPTFKNAQGLSVNVVTSKGQSQFEVTRDKPNLDLGGIM